MLCVNAISQVRASDQRADSRGALTFFLNDPAPAPSKAADYHTTMKNPITRLLSVAAIGSALLLSSCVSPYAGPNEKVGGVLGAAAGGLAGAIIGNQSGRPLEGGAIGGVIGALAGSALGSVNDDVYYGRSYSRPSYSYSRPTYYSGSYYRSYSAPRYYSSHSYCPPPVIHHHHGYGGHCW
jgi:hypothetical protein